MALLDKNANKAFNMTGLLFGNIDSDGQLEESFLDDDARRQLSSLNAFGFNTVFEDVISHEEIVGESPIYFEDDDIIIKEEVISDDSSLNSDDDAQNFIEVCEETSKSLPESFKPEVNEKAIDVDINQETCEEHEEKEETSESLPGNFESAAEEEAIDSQAEEIYEENEKILVSLEDKEKNCPYFSILPSKYKDVEVSELFPDFRCDKALRFNRIFGPGKEKNLPNIWRNARKIKKSIEKSHQKQDESSDLNPEDNKSNSRGWVMNYGPDPEPDQCASDDELKLLAPIEVKKNLPDIEEKKKNVNSGPSAKDWRFGPAQFWYDMIKVPETGDGFDYGFKLGENQANCDEKEKVSNDIDDDAFLMVSQLHWEDDIIWDPSEVKHKVKNGLNRKISSAGWIPSTVNRKARNNLMSTCYQSSLNAEESNFSLLPMENEDLVYGTWEDEVIWDAENMTKIPEPKILTLDLNDDNIILQVPDDVDSKQSQDNNGTQRKAKTSLPYAKKSKTILSQQGILNFNDEEEEKIESKSLEVSEDPFNISNDGYYAAIKTVTTFKLKRASGVIQHSTPVIQLREPFIQTYMNPTKLRNFHRLPLRRYNHGPLAYPAHHQIYSLSKYIEIKAAVREQERLASGGGDIFFMRTPEDLTGRDGGLILLEFIEEHPPLMNQVGMCSKITTYYKRKACKDVEPPKFKYGETLYAHTSPFLGSLMPGQSIQAIENNMYRAPIYEHKLPQTDFLIIRTRDKYFIREIDDIFTVGQQCPLHRVPAPNSKLAVKFSRDFLLVYIYRLFWKSNDTPRRIKMEDIKKAFPLYSESNIRKRLKLCAIFKRTGMYSNWWVIRSDFRLPSEEEIQSMVTPEQCCAYFSMKAGEQRLKDAGYGENIFLTNDDDDDFQVKIEDEVKVAPWNTTTAYIQAMEGKCILQLNGPADPTGCGEGFSYIRMSNKPVINKAEQEQVKKHLIGSEKDLRRLNLPDAKRLLKKFGVSDGIINKLNRWEMVDMVRTYSTAKAKAGEEDEYIYSRGNRFSVVEHQERYKEEAQRLFNLQNALLASNEVLSTDEDESSGGNSDIEAMGKNIENILTNKTSTRQLSLKQEEQERLELKQMMMDKSSKKNSKNNKNDNDYYQSKDRVLKIVRTFHDSQGNPFTRTEEIRNSAVIDLYLKLKNSNNKKIINDFLLPTVEQKEEQRKEKRRIQEQLRRIKKQQERASKNGLSNNQNNQLKKDSIVKCSSCGNLSHTSRCCPVYKNRRDSSPVQDIASYQKQVDSNIDHDLVKVNGTKLRFSTKLIKQIQAENNYEYNKSCTDKYTEDRNLKKRSRSSRDSIDYNESISYIKPPKRRQTDPVISMSLIFEKIIEELKRLPGVEPFLLPVHKKQAKDYYNIIKNPMDLQTIRENVRKYKYETREKFLDDMNLIVKNSSIYNGPIHILTVTAQRILQVCAQKLKEKEESLITLEKAINPFMGDNAKSQLAFILETIMNNKLKSMAEARLFLSFKKFIKRNNIRTPMDLDMITRKISLKEYRSRYTFLQDVKLILENNILSGSPFVRESQLLVKVCEESLGGYDEILTKIENEIVSKSPRQLEASNSFAIIPSPGNSNPSESGFINCKSEENEFIDVEGDDENSMSLPDNVIMNTNQEFQFNYEENCNIIKMEGFSENLEAPEEKIDVYQDLECSDDDDDDDRPDFSEVPERHVLQDIPDNKINLLEELEISSEEEIKEEIDLDEMSRDIDSEIWS
ncbi:Similar to Taf1: Transcription initiation factor TFIID subunit 1 (Drosophila melanogaster) [Cotesia congregata]|uniref:Transcription initiation factor TFIID subunit 1 n=1 Tax=Cotesia congregata TaxID=51543 RepID=A0A8J2MIC8_COTCN|nr:Similar to Taf1: Transcription initiation factor TFIID subunit 1 (Drosophila melanogaster) [Cotesia congregata]